MAGGNLRPRLGLPVDPHESVLKDINRARVACRCKNQLGVYLRRVDSRLNISLSLSESSLSQLI